jgi:hypothetical protein
MHLTEEAVQVLPAQQGCPAPPQVPQTPFWHIPPMVGQADPLAVQVWPTQQPPEAQVLSAQQICPAPPHWAHRPWPAPVHMSAVEQLRPEQQVSPAPPQATQVPAPSPVQTPPLAQLRLAQQD